ncbi:hypothetical protein SAMN05421799_1161, partial [Alicyclobacillus vulcanalis]
KTVDIVPNGTKLTDVTQYTQTVNLHLLTGHYLYVAVCTLHHSTVSDKNANLFRKQSPRR